MVTDEQTREALAVIVKKTEQKFGGPSLAEFGAMSVKGMRAALRAAGGAR